MKERRKEDLDVKGRRLFVGVARVERFFREGRLVVGLLSERRCDEWRRETQARNGKTRRMSSNINPDERQNF